VRRRGWIDADPDSIKGTRFQVLFPIAVAS